MQTVQCHLGVKCCRQRNRDERAHSFIFLPFTSAGVAIKHFVMQMFRNNNSALRSTGVPLCELSNESSIRE